MMEPCKKYSFQCWLVLSSDLFNAALSFNWNFNTKKEDGGNGKVKFGKDGVGVDLSGTRL